MAQNKLLRLKPMLLGFVCCCIVELWARSQLTLFAQERVLGRQERSSSNLSAPWLQTQAKEEKTQTTTDDWKGSFPESTTLSTPKSNAPKTASTGLSKRALDDWCPHAKCHVTDICHPCKRRYLILIATGRSASTTLQKMLSSLPGIRLSGENNGMLRNFMEAIDATRKNRRWREVSAPWAHNPFPHSAYACVTQQMLETINPPANSNGRFHTKSDSATIVGFKTVRFPLAIEEANASETKDAIEIDLQRAAGFLLESFPCSKIIINVRLNVTSQVSSIQQYFGGPGKLTDRDVVSLLLASQTKQLLQFGKLLGPERTRIVDSSKWTKNVTYLNELVSWLGFTPSCHFTQTFQFNTRRGFGAGNITNRPNPPSCLELPV